MAIQIKHAFVSAKGDGGDATLVRPSNWNAVHSTSMASGQLIGRLTAGAGAFEEIPISAYMASLLEAADAATLAGLLGLFDTGDIKFTYKSAAPAGWLLMTSPVAGSNTIGNAASGATLRANADTLALFTLLYGAMSDAVAPVSGGRSGNAATDFAADKTITVPPIAGYSVVAAASVAAAGITTKALGTTVGTETVTLGVANFPPYTPTGSITNGAVFVNVNNANAGSTSTGGGGFPCGGNSVATIGIAQNPSTFNGAPQGGTSTPTSIMQPVRALNVLVKL